MGNFEMINFDEILSSYGIDLNAATKEEKERLQLAWKSAADMDAFVKLAKEILKTEK